MAALALEADPSVRSVAERLVVAAAAAAQARLVNARHDPTGATDDFKVTAHLERAVCLRIDVQRTVAHRQGVGADGARFPGCGKLDVVVRAIAKRLVMRGAAAAKSRTKAGILTGEP